MSENRMIGFLGCGSMGECILRGCLDRGIVAAADVRVCNRSPSTNERLTRELDVVSCSAVELVRQCGIVMLGVGPGAVLPVLDSVRDAIAAETLIVSMAAGVTLAAMTRHTPRGTRLVRVMPNTATLVGCGLTSVTANECVSAEEERRVLGIFECLGRAVFVPESAIHGVIGVGGSSTAHCFLLLEALADGGVRGGLTRAQATEFAAQALYGSARMLQDSGRTPGELKDMVCSPGGGTIEAIRFLERSRMRSTVIEAVIASMRKSQEMERVYMDA